MPGDPWLALAVAGAAGLGLGLGIILGVAIVRALRRYMRDRDPEHPTP